MEVTLSSILCPCCCVIWCLKLFHAIDANNGLAQCFKVPYFFRKTHRHCAALIVTTTTDGQSTSKLEWTTFHDWSEWARHERSHAFSQQLLAVPEYGVHNWLEQEISHAEFTLNVWARICMPRWLKLAQWLLQHVAYNRILQRVISFIYILPAGVKVQRWTVRKQVWWLMLVRGAYGWEATVDA